ncbi:MAG TPA: DNA mismatch repair endonuclease MutL, partial [Allocoleopsis sp.]
MNIKIKTLPKEVINLIAAGEVIDSLGAVVRELAENSIDAGANRIHISILPEIWQVRVTDNGHGMNLSDLKMAALPHTTSKINNIQDLGKITSLGFRGEALHSIATLADLEIISSVDEGYKINYNSGGEVKKETNAAIAKGTIVTVSNLFKNWSGKRAGITSVNQQLKAVQNVIYQIALCHPHITWILTQNEKKWLNISPGKTAKDILIQIIKELNLTDLQSFTLPVTDQAEDCEIKVVLGLPDRCHRHRPDWLKVAVNGRIIKSPELEQIIITAFSRTLPRDRYPICLIHLQISAEQVDWTRQPSKSEIFLQNISFWQEKITYAIHQTLNFNPESLSETMHNQRVGNILKVAEEQAGYNTKRNLPEVNNKKTEIGLVELKAVAQLHNTYIVAEHPKGIWLIEQHIAHERVLYEQLCERWQIVPLETAIILQNLTPNRVEQLQRIGLEIDVFGFNLWAVRTIPAMLKNREDCTDALLELSLGGDLQTAQVAIACRSAIRNGT